MGFGWSDDSTATIEGRRRPLKEPEGPTAAELRHKRAREVRAQIEADKVFLPELTSEEEESRPQVSPLSDATSQANRLQRRCSVTLIAPDEEPAASERVKRKNSGRKRKNVVRAKGGDVPSEKTPVISTSVQPKVSAREWLRKVNLERQLDPQYSQTEVQNWQDPSQSHPKLPYVTQVQVPVNGYTMPYNGAAAPQPYPQCDPTAGGFPGGPYLVPDVGPQCVYPVRLSNMSHDCSDNDWEME